MRRTDSTAFYHRLRDLLSTVEAATLASTADVRVRGLREHLAFACATVPCDEALVAIEREAFGRLEVPVVVRPDGFEEPGVELVALGTPFAHLLAGGDAFGISLEQGDPALAPLAGCLRSSPRGAAFAPLRAGGGVVGGVALFREAGVGDREVRLAQQLGEVLSLTIESYRTERVAIDVFARVLPDVLAPELGTSLRAALELAVRELRAHPSYRLHLRLATLAGRIAGRGAREGRLALELLERLDAYFAVDARPEPLPEGEAPR